MIKGLMKFVLLVVGVSLLSACGSGGGSNQDNAVPPQQLNINVTSINIDGAFTLNGLDFPASIYESGTLYLVDAENNLAPLSETYNNAYAVSVVAGTYSNVYRLDHGGALVPSNVGDTIVNGQVLNSGQTLDIDVPAELVSFNFTLNGGAFPVSEYDDALFYLTPTSGNGDSILLGNSHSPIADVLLLPGNYDVVYEVETPGGTVPLNQHAVIGSLAVTNSPLNVNLNITTVSFRLDASMTDAGMNPVNFPVSQYEHARFYLRNTASSDLVDLGTSYELPLSNIPVIDGSYDIVYAHQNGDSIPLNENAIISTAVDIGAVPAQNIVIPTAIITPSYTLDGVAFQVSEYQDALIYLRGSTSTDDLLLLGNTHGPSPVTVVQGTYDVIYQHETGNEVPQNTFAIIDSGVSINTDTALPVAVTSINVAGVFTLNGGSFPASQNNRANFRFRDSANPQDEFLFGLSHLSNEAVKLIPGTYDIIYNHEAGSGVPQNTGRAAQSSILLDSDQSLRVNVESREVSPQFTLNGVAFPASIYQSGDFYLRDVTNGDRFYLGSSYQDNDAVMAITGSYNVLYEHLNGNQVPVNERAVVDTVLVQQ